MNSRKLYKAQRLLARTPGLITRERVRRILLSSGLRPSPELIDALMIPAVEKPVEKSVEKSVEKPAAKKTAPKADKPKAPAKKKTARKSAAKKTEEVSNG
jgi:ribosomal protein L12E/L44/L45/RPP1/RPP2